MQAARGASLSPSDPDPQTPSTRRPRLVFAGLAATLFLIDLAVKEWALSALAHRDISVVGDVFVLNLVFNPGAAFGTGTRFTWVFSCLALAAIVLVVWLSRRLADPVWAVGLGFLLGGVSGNFFDRIFREPGPMRGHVVDLFQLPNWPVFNVADICINVAAGLILIQTFRGVRLDGTREKDDEPAGESAS